jgi:DNA repair protein RecN (Recombination protein N)
MLTELYIKNFILIEQLHLCFAPGLNVLSGETGAGKSIVLDALGLLLGERSHADYVRRDQEKAVIEAVFTWENHPELDKFLAENDLLAEDELIVTRELHANGKSAARVGGRAVPLALLKRLSGYLIDLHAQDDQLGFIAPAMYAGYVDSYLPDPAPRQLVQELFAALSAKRQELKQINIDDQERLQRLDFLNFQIAEIEAVNPQAGEDEELRRLAERIGAAHRLLGAINVLRENLARGKNGGSAALDLLAEALETSRKVGDDAFFAEWNENVASIYYNLQDALEQLGHFEAELDFEPGMLDTVQNRLFELHRLQKKYGATTEDILQRLILLREEREKWQDVQEQREAITRQIKALEQEYLAAARTLSALRLTAKVPLEESVYRELLELNLPHMRFEIQLQPRENYAADGIDEVAFMFSSNPGEDLRPLARIASGGERSRFILALKKSLAHQYQIGSMVFDEIDSGLSGVSLNSMADKLHDIAQDRQILLVTHSPQIASRADRHFFIEKSVDAHRTSTRVQELDEPARVAELARMIDGDRVTELSLQHARVMREQGL